MSLDADHVIKHFEIGHKLIYSNHEIAEVVSIKLPIIEIRDIHGRKWALNQAHLGAVKYATFLSNLADVIAKKCPAEAPAGSARQVLINMKTGDPLQDNAGYLATLIDVYSDNGKGPVLTFRDINEQRTLVYPQLLSDDYPFEAFIEQFRNGVIHVQNNTDEPALLRYFKNEFIPKMLSQLDYDNQRWGDSWMMLPSGGQEADIQEHIDQYFEYFNQFGKKIPWLKMAGYAVIAQAREDHPEWLL